MEKIYVIVTPQNDVMPTPALSEEIAKQFIASCGKDYRYFPVDVSYIRAVEVAKSDSASVGYYYKLRRLQDALGEFANVLDDLRAGGVLE